MKYQRASLKLYIEKLLYELELRLQDQSHFGALKSQQYLFWRRNALPFGSRGSRRTPRNF